MQPQTIGRYKVLEKLGQGGMGTVYKAHDPLIERIVAVKTITAQLDQDPDLRTRFFREARAAGQLSHKNIITIHDLGEEEGQVFLAMEFLEGEDLAAKLARGPRMRLERKLDIMADLCEGLAHAHSKGVVHRDLKPANVFITTTGHVKILDFGLARMLTSDMTKSQTTIGTPNYMSPEQVRGERVDHRSDIFSLGVVFYELLTSKRPFSGESFASVIYKILQIDPEPVDKLDPEVPTPLASLVHRALAKDLAERYQQITDLQLELEILRQGFRTGQFSVHDRIGQVEDSADPGFDPDETRIETRWPRTPSPYRVSPIPSTHVRVPSPAPPTRAVVGATEEQRPEIATPPSGRRWILPLIATALAAMVVWYATDRWRRPADIQAPAATATPPAPGSPAVPPAPTDQNALARSLSQASAALDERQYGEAMRLAKEALALAPGNTDAEKLLKRAEESAALLTQKNAEAKSLIDGGRYADAAKLVGEALTLSPSDVAAQQQAARLGDVARRTADDALRQMRQARSRAEGAGAPELAEAIFGAARNREQQAMQLYRTKRYGEAMARLFEAGSLYRTSELHARTEQQAKETSRQADVQRERETTELETSSARYEATRIEAQRAGADMRAPELMRQGTERATDAEAKRSAGDIAGARSDFEAAALFMQQAQAASLAAARIDAIREPPRAEPAAPPPAAPPPVPAVDDRADVLSVVERYRAALEARNLASVKAVWNLTPAQEEALRVEFRNARALHVTIADTAVQIAGTEATVRCLRGYEVTTTDGQHLKTETRTVLKLQRTGNAWMIQSVQHQPI